MKDLNLQEWLRYGFAGAVLLLTLLAKYKLPESILLYFKEDKSVIVLGIVFVLGSLIYTIHRVILYPIFYRIGSVIFLYKKEERNLWLVNPWYVDRALLRIDIKRWERLLEENGKNVQNCLREWGSQIHYLYCVSWAIALAIMTGKALKWNVQDSSMSNYLNFKFFSVLLFFSIVHHFRCLAYEKGLQSD